MLQDQVFISTGCFKPLNRIIARDCNLSCIVHCAPGRRNRNVDPISENQYNQIKKTAELRRKYEKNEKNLQLFREIPNEVDITKHGIHKNCYKKFTANVKRHEKRAHSRLLFSNFQCSQVARGGCYHRRLQTNP